MRPGPGQGFYRGFRYLARNGCTVASPAAAGVFFWSTECTGPLGCATQALSVCLLFPDCNDDLSDCSLAEMDALRDWMAQFYGKYKVVGRVVSSAERIEPATGAVEAEADVEQEEADTSTDKNKDD